MSATTVIARRGRLEMYRQGADTPVYWDAHWKQHPPQTMQGMGMYIGFRSAIEKFMPRDGLIIEAGCGNGNTARTIRAAGFDIEGVDFAEHAIEANRAIDPAGRYQVGDVRSLPYASGSLGGYISLGVIEHFQDADRRLILREAARCLRPGGTALVTVPHYNLIRRVRYAAASAKVPDEIPFYQYFFSRDEIVAELRAVGLTVVCTDAYDIYKGLKDTLPVKSMLDRMRTRSKAWARRIDHPHRIFRLWCGHMLLVVATKPGISVESQQAWAA